MKAGLFLLVVLAVVCFEAHSAAADAFPGKPKISMAYDQLSRAVLNLEKFKPGEPPEHVKKVVEFLDVARLNLDQAAKNKGSAPGAAIKLIEKTKEILANPNLDKAKIDEATALTKEALKKTNQAGGVPR